jgi:hypothetical protein
VADPRLGCWQSVSELLFSYGTLRRRDVQLATFGRELGGYLDYRRISVPLRSGAQAWVYVFAG